MYIVAGIVGMKSKDEATAGTIAFCAFADLANAPAGGRFTHSYQIIPPIGLRQN